MMKEKIDLARSAISAVRGVFAGFQAAFSRLAETEALWRDVERAVTANGLALADNEAQLESYLDRMLEQGGIMHNVTIQAFTRTADAAAGAGLSFQELIASTELLQNITAATGRSLDETARALARVRQGDIEPLKELNVQLWEALSRVADESERARLAQIALDEQYGESATGVESQVSGLARLEQASISFVEFAASAFVDTTEAVATGIGGIANTLHGRANPAIEEGNMWLELFGGTAAAAVPTIDQLERGYGFASESAGNFAEQLEDVVRAQEAATVSGLEAYRVRMLSSGAFDPGAIGAWIDEDDGGRGGGGPSRRDRADADAQEAAEAIAAGATAQLEALQSQADLELEIRQNVAEKRLEQIEAIEEAELRLMQLEKDKLGVAIESASAEEAASDAAMKSARTGARALAAAILEASGARQAYDALRALEEGAEAIASLAIGDFGGAATHTAAAIQFAAAAGTSVNVGGGGGGSRGRGSVGRAPREDAFAAQSASRYDSGRESQGRTVHFSIGAVFPRDEGREVFGAILDERRMLREDI